LESVNGAEFPTDAAVLLRSKGCIVCMHIDAIIPSNLNPHTSVCKALAATSPLEQVENFNA